MKLLFNIVTIALMGLSFEVANGRPLTSEEKLTCDAENDFQCPADYRCKIEWREGPFKCVKVHRAFEGFFLNFLGHYTVQMKIGNKTFLDQMEIISFGADQGPIQKKFKGDFIVVGAFTSAIQNGSVHYLPWAGNYQISFEIVAVENGRKFPVYFKATGYYTDTGYRFMGRAYSPTPDQEMGSFVMTQDSKD